MTRIPTTNPFPVNNNNQIHFQNKQTHFFPKSGCQNLPKNTTPIRFRILQPASDNNINTPIVYSQKPSVDLTYSPINRINKQNFQYNQFLIQPSPTKLTTKGKPGNMADFINMGKQRPKSPINHTGQILKQINHNYMTNHQNYVIKEQNIHPAHSLKKNSLIIPGNISLNRSPKKIQDQEQKKLKNHEMDIIKNCGKQPQPNMNMNIKKSNSKNDIFNYNTSKVPQNKTSVGLNSHKAFKTLGKESVHNPFGKEKQKNSNSISISLLCINDGKKAKYRVKSDQQDDDQPMYCCSKCAICLVQQGFKVIQIQKNPRDKELNQLLGKISELNKKISSKKEKIGKLLQQNEKNYIPQLERVDSYYNSLISMLQELRVRDRETIIHYRKKSQKQVQNLDKELVNASERLNQIESDIRPAIEQIKNKIQEQDYSRFMKKYHQDIKSIAIIIEISQQCSEKQIFLTEDNQIQQKFDNFTYIFPQQFGLKISKASQQNQNIESTKNILQNKILQSKGMKLNLPPKSMFCHDEIQQEQQFLQEKLDQRYIQQQKKPFRNLFPQESDQQIQLCQQLIQNQQQINKQFQRDDDYVNDQNQDCCSPNFKKI